METIAVDLADRSRPSSRTVVLRESALILTVLACLPYLALKAAWVFGSQIGIPAGSVLLQSEVTMRFVNGLTFAMDAAVVALAFALARPWGRRIPAWLIAGPMWLATGLLTPFLVAGPLQLAVGTAGGGLELAPDFLDSWVFMVVSGGFILQGLGLAVLLTLHVARRWGHLWRGRVADLPPLPTAAAARLSVIGAAVVGLIPLVMNLGWASGAGWLRPEADSHAQTFIVHGVQAGLTLAAFAGALALVRGRTRLDARIPLVAAWVGSSTVGAWGAWQLFVAVLAVPAGQDPTTPGLIGVYALCVTSGAMLLVTGAHLFAGWAAAHDQG